jgi:hypothetical protein
VRLEAGKLGPVEVKIHGLNVKCFSIYCAVAAILSTTLRYEGHRHDLVDYTHAIVVLLCRWYEALTPRKAPTCVTVMFPIRTTDGVTFLPQLEEPVFALGTTKSRVGLSKAQREEWRKSRSELLNKVLGNSSAIPLQVRLSELENLRRTTDPLHMAQLQLFFKRLTPEDTKDVTQSVGDCAETVPLAVMANMQHVGSVATISVRTDLVRHIQPLLRIDELRTNVVTHRACLNCRFGFARAELAGTTVRELCDLELGTEEAAESNTHDDSGLVWLPAISQSTIDDMCPDSGQPVKPPTLAAEAQVPDNSANGASRLSKDTPIAVHPGKLFKGNGREGTSPSPSLQYRRVSRGSSTSAKHAEHESPRETPSVCQNSSCSSTLGRARRRCSQEVIQEHLIESRDDANPVYSEASQMVMRGENVRQEGPDRGTERPTAEGKGNPKNVPMDDSVEGVSPGDRYMTVDTGPLSCVPLPLAAIALPGAVDGPFAPSRATDKHAGCETAGTELPPFRNGKPSKCRSDDNIPPEPSPTGSPSEEFDAGLCTSQPASLPSSQCRPLAPVIFSSARPSGLDCRQDAPQAMQKSRDSLMAEPKAKLTEENDHAEEAGRAGLGSLTDKASKQQSYVEMPFNGMQYRTTCLGPSPSRPLLKIDDCDTPAATPPPRPETSAHACRPSAQSLETADPPHMEPLQSPMEDNVLFPGWRVSRVLRPQALPFCPAQQPPCPSAEYQLVCPLSAAAVEGQPTSPMKVARGRGQPAAEWKGTVETVEKEDAKVAGQPDPLGLGSNYKAYTLAEASGFRFNPRTAQFRPIGELSGSRLNPRAAQFRPIGQLSGFRLNPRAVQFRPIGEL